ncbi:hypothetical protein VM1G_11691 [Cytospora mali]|uniref:Uncharacterized protein n=1 Tax=Cytospora mali TaxID=578113 RepID=A0A194W3F3_CYTMA|nr:hypothetical protein VM1G_11691 [Valsa mali]
MAANTFSSLAAHLRAHTIPSPSSPRSTAPPRATAASSPWGPAASRTTSSAGPHPGHPAARSEAGHAQRPFSDPNNRGPYEPYGTRGPTWTPGREARGPGVRRAAAAGDAAGQVRARMAAFLEELAARSSGGFLAIRPSGLEGVGTPAFVVACMPAGRRCPGS